LEISIFTSIESFIYAAFHLKMLSKKALREMTDKPDKKLEERVTIVEDGERKKIEEKYGLDPKKGNGGAVYLKSETRQGSSGEWEKKVKFIIDDTKKKQLIEINKTETVQKGSTPSNVEMRAYGKNTIEAEKPAGEILRKESNYVEIKQSSYGKVEGRIYYDDKFAYMKFVVPNKLGLHARPSMLLAKTAQRYDGKILLVREDIDLEIDGKSVLAAMMLGAEKGAELIVKAEKIGSPERIFNEIYSLVKANFHEDK